MDQEVLRRRSSVFDIVFKHSLLAYRHYVPVSFRWFLEILLLCLAFITFLLWAYVHFTYIMGSEDCLHNMTQRPFPSDVILQVEVYSNDSDLWLKRQTKVQQIYNDIYRGSCSSDKSRSLTREEFLAETCSFGGIWSWIGLPHACRLSMSVIFSGLELVDTVSNYDNFKQDKEDVNQKHVNQVQQKKRRNSVNDTRGKLMSDICPKTDIFSRSSSKDSVVISRYDKGDFGKNYTLFDLFDYYELQVLTVDYTIFEFSQEPGYLSLSKSMRYKLGIPIQTLYVDPSKNTCFGGSFGKFLTKYFLGYEMMVISSFKDLMPQTYGMGYVKNLMSGNQYYYRVQWMGRWRYGAGILPALFFTLVASVLLRQIHYHIFKFLTHFNHLLNQGVPIPIQTGAQIPFLVITYATIGLVIVMSEVLGDDSVFSLLMVGTVWHVDQFYSVYCKQQVSKVYLPWFFFLFHFLPYAYYIRFNGQFWFLPFAFHWFMLQHVMLYLVHHHELPALNRIFPVPVQRPRRHVIVRARPLAPTDVETAQMASANFTQINPTVLQPVQTETPDMFDQHSSDELEADEHDTDSEASSFSTDLLLRSTLHQPDDSSSQSLFDHTSLAEDVALAPVEESGLRESSDDRLSNLHKQS